MAVQKVTMTHSVTFFIKGDSPDQISDWMASHTPNEAIELIKKNGKMPENEDYSEEVECDIMDNSDYDIDISSEE